MTKLWSGKIECLLKSKINIHGKNRKELKVEILKICKIKYSPLNVTESEPTEQLNKNVKDRSQNYSTNKYIGIYG